MMSFFFFSLWKVTTTFEFFQYFMYIAAYIEDRLIIILKRMISDPMKQSYIIENFQMSDNIHQSRWLQYYLPIQNLPNMLDNISSEISSPLICPSAKAASLRSIVQKSRGISSWIDDFNLTKASLVRISCSHCLWKL